MHEGYSVECAPVQEGRKVSCLESPQGEVLTGRCRGVIVECDSVCFSLCNVASVKSRWIVV